MSSISEINSKEIFFLGVSHIIELFPAPIPEVIETESGKAEIDTALDLMRMSHWFGTDELYLPSGSSVIAKTEEHEFEIDAAEFIKLQLKKASLETLYYIVNKVDASDAIVDILDFDAEHAKDDNYDPIVWLSEYQSDSLDQGVAFLARLREEEPSLLFDTIAKCCLDPYTGLVCWLQDDITDDFGLRHDYDDWAVRIAVVFEGKFFPYAPAGWIEADHSGPLSLDDWVVKSIFIRNYDEG